MTATLAIAIAHAWAAAIGGFDPSCNRIGVFHPP
jgi:hypothetical protein